jgi:hypothetical protein
MAILSERHLEQYRRPESLSRGLSRTCFSLSLWEILMARYSFGGLLSFSLTHTSSLWTTFHWPMPAGPASSQYSLFAWTATGDKGSWVVLASPQFQL